MDNRNKFKMDECNICYNKFTAKIRQPITCYHADCKTTICLKCFKRSLFMENSEQECLACKKPISTEFIFRTTPRIFKKEFVKKINQRILIQEKTLLESTQERLNVLAKSNRIEKRIKHIRKYLYQYEDNDYDEFLQFSLSQKKKINNFLEKNDEEIHPVNTFFCPLIECYGLVKRNQCTECLKYFCGKCYNQQLDDHKCNADDLATIKFLKYNLKPCPKCKILIQKNNGCDQMFCTKCKTGFSWRTLTIHKRIIHNPYYNEYRNQLENGNVHFFLDNNECGEQLAQALRKMNQSKEYERSSMKDMITKTIRTDQFIPKVLNETSIILTRLIYDVYDDETIRQTRREFREAFLRERKRKPIQVAENRWLNKLIFNYKQRELKKDLYQILEIFDRGFKDSVINSYETNNYDQLFENIKFLISFLKVQLKENEKKFGIKNKTSISVDHGIVCRLY